MKILITGGAGFLGRHLCSHMRNEGHEIICMDNLFTSRRSNIHHLLDDPQFEFFRHDVCEPWHIECDVIFHLACPASPVQYQRNPVNTIKTAFMGTLNALECARNSRAKIIITSTSEVYGDPTISPQPESYFGNVNPVGLRSCYDEGKRAGESLAVSWAMQYGTDVRIARLFNCFGPYMSHDDGRLIPNFIDQAMRGEDLTVYGDGSQTRSFCYVSDTIRGLVKLGEMSGLMPDGSTPVINIGNPNERTILSVAKGIIETFGNKSGIQYKPFPSDDPKQRCPDITLARRILGWEPKIDYETGIRETIQWFLQNKVQR